MLDTNNVVIPCIGKLVVGEVYYVRDRNKDWKLFQTEYVGRNKRNEFVFLSGHPILIPQTEITSFIIQPKNKELSMSIEYSYLWEI